MRYRASYLDQQSEVRTKIQDKDADRLDALAKRWSVSGYEAARRLLLRAMQEAEETGRYLDGAGHAYDAPPVIPRAGISRQDPPADPPEAYGHPRRPGASR